MCVSSATMRTPPQNAHPRATQAAACHHCMHKLASARTACSACVCVCVYAVGMESARGQDCCSGRMRLEMALGCPHAWSAASTWALTPPSTVHAAELAWQLCMDGIPCVLAACASTAASGCGGCGAAFELLLHSPLSQTVLEACIRRACQHQTQGCAAGVDLHASPPLTLDLAAVHSAAAMGVSTLDFM
ncbi:hypothetical protein EON67_11050, partial [archaeon]